jgi:hypothetical protein
VNDSPTKPDLEQVVLEKVRLRFQQSISLQDLYLRQDQLYLDTYLDHMVMNLVVRLEATLTGRRGKTLTDERLEYAEWPADWWAALKARWFPAWWLRRWPARVKVFEVLRRTDTTVYRVCPHLPTDRPRDHLEYLLQRD